MARGDTNAASVSTRATSFLMLLFFGWAYARVMKVGTQGGKEGRERSRKGSIIFRP